MKKISMIIGLITVFLLLSINSTSNFTLFHQFPHPKIPPHAYLTSLIQKKQPKLSKSTAQEIARAVYKYSRPFPPRLIIALIERESSLIPHKTSKSNCIGLMQINPEAHPGKVAGFSRSELYDIDTNVKIGCMILREYYDLTGTISGALKRYLGADNIKYKMDILTNFTDEIILKNSKQ